MPYVLTQISKVIATFYVQTGYRIHFLLLSKHNTSMHANPQKNWPYHHLNQFLDL